MTIAWQRQWGFNLIELMMTLALLAILAGIAAPSFNATLERWATRTQANGLARALNLARSKAINGGVVVTIERIAGTANNWSTGWRIFVDGDSIVSAYDGSCSPPTPPAVNNCDELISAISLDTRTMSILSNGSASDRVSFNAQGRLITPPTTDRVFAVCDDEYSTSFDGSRIRVSATGRIQMETIVAANKATECTSP